MQSFSSEELIGRIKAGDGEALNDWLARNRPRLKEWTEGHVGVPPGRGADASDLVQTATLYVAGHIQQFRGHTEAELLAWVRETLRCRAIDLSRKPQLHALAAASSTDPSAATGPWTPVAAGSTPSQSAARREEEEQAHALRGKKEEQIDGARECLTEQQFQVFRRREAHGRPLKTVAAELGLTAVETARLFYQAQHLLRDKLPERQSTRRHARRAFEATPPRTAGPAAAGHRTEARRGLLTQRNRRSDGVYAGRRRGGDLPRNEGPRQDVGRNKLAQFRRPVGWDQLRGTRLRVGKRRPTMIEHDTRDGGPALATTTTTMGTWCPTWCPPSLSHPTGTHQSRPSSASRRWTSAMRQTTTVPSARPHATRALEASNSD